MPRYIDADALLKHEIEADRMGAMLVVGKGYILEAPEIDAVPVVRCGECKYAVWEKNEIKYCETWGAKCDCPYEIALTATDHCSYGAKMEDKPCR